MRHAGVLLAADRDGRPVPWGDLDVTTLRLVDGNAYKVRGAAKDPSEQTRLSGSDDLGRRRMTNLTSVMAAIE